MRRANKIAGATWTERGLAVELDVGRLLVQCPSETIVRLRLEIEGEGFVPAVLAEADRCDEAVLSAWQAASLAEDEIVLPLGEAVLQLGKRPFSFQIINNEDLIIASLPRRTFGQDRLGRLWHYQIKQEDDRYFGLGEKSGRLLRNNRRFRMGNVDAIGYDPEFGDPLYKHIPFYMKHSINSGQTVGIFLNNAYPSEFDFGSERSGYWEPYSSIGVDGGALDLFLLLGPTPGDVLRQYYTVTGFPALPPLVSLGYLGSTMSYTELPERSDEAVLGFVAQCEKLGIPLSGFHLSSGYTTGVDGKRTVFHWHNGRFPDPAQFVQKMGEAGQVLSPNVKPALLTTHPLWPKFDASGAFIRTADGSQSLTARFWGGEASFVDFSNPKARDLWHKHLKQSLLDLGVTSIWNDNNEFELDDDLALCDNDGESTVAVGLRPFLANLMAQVGYEALREMGDLRPFVLSRAGFAGLQRFAQTWSGDNSSDWRNFYFNLATMLGMSLSGMPFNGMDVGGFAGPAPAPELFLRWVQNGVFHPRFSIHSVNSDNTVTEPWLYPSLTPFIRRAIQTRYLFLPTLYALAARAHFDGEPVVAPLFYHFPSETALHNCHTQFLVGEGLMAVAITEPDLIELAIVFPSGDWRCFYTGEQYEGGQTHLVSLVQDYSPLFYRAGSGFLLDMGWETAVWPEKQFASNSLLVHLAMTVGGELFIYEDDGETMAFSRGELAKGWFRWHRAANELRLTFEREGAYKTKWERLYLRLEVGVVCPTAVLLDGEPLRQVLYREGVFEEGGNGRFYYNAETQAVMLPLSASQLNYNFEISLLFGQAIQISQEMEHG